MSSPPDPLLLFLLCPGGWAFTGSLAWACLIGERDVSGREERGRCVSPSPACSGSASAVAPSRGCLLSLRLLHCLRPREAAAPSSPGSLRTSLLSVPPAPAAPKWLLPSLCLHTAGMKPQTLQSRSCRGHRVCAGRQRI